MTRKPTSRVDFASLKRVVPLTAILSHYGLDGEFRRRGPRLTGACPIHKGSNKRQFVIDPNANTWRCFGDCDRGGAALEFVAAMENVSIIEAAGLIAGWFAIDAGTGLANHRKQQRRSTMSGERPSHKVFVVEDRGDDKDFWHRVGSAWPHGDGKGLTIQLPPGLSVGGRVSLREYSDDDAVEDEKKVQKKRK